MSSLKEKYGSKIATNDASSTPTVKYEKRFYHTLPKAGADPKFFRILPGHSEFDGVEIENPRAFETKRGAYLSIFDKQSNEQRQKFIFDSRTHGGSSQDLINAYINFAKKKNKELNGEKNPTADFLDKMLTAGHSYTDPKLKIQTTFLCYAVEVDKEGNLITELTDEQIKARVKTDKNFDADKFHAQQGVGLLELKVSIFNAMKEIAIKYYKDDKNPIPETDRLSTFYLDLEEGFPVSISLSDKNEYTTTTFTKKIEVPGAKGKMITVDATTSLSLTEEVMDAWEKLESLANQMRNKYQKSDWDFQVEGVQNFEEYISQNQETKGFFDIFTTPEFQVEFDRVQANVFGILGIPIKESESKHMAVVPQERVSVVAPITSFDLESGRNGDDDDEDEDITDEELEAMKAKVKGTKK